MNKVILNGTDLKIEDVVNEARHGYQVELAPADLIALVGGKTADLTV